MKASFAGCCCVGWFDGGGNLIYFVQYIIFRDVLAEEIFHVKAGGDGSAFM